MDNMTWTMTSENRTISVLLSCVDLFLFLYDLIFHGNSSCNIILLFMDVQFPTLLLHVTLGDVIFMFHGVACFGIWEAALYINVRQLYSLFILGGGVDGYVRQFWLKE